MNHFLKGFAKQAAAPVPRRVLRAALIGGVTGGAAGATADKKNRWRGGAEGALAGGAIGAVAGKYHHKTIASATKAKRKSRKSDIDSVRKAYIKLVLKKAKHGG